MNTTPNPTADHPSPERTDLLGQFGFSQGGGITFHAEWWAGRPMPSLRIRRTSRNGAVSSFSVSPAHRGAFLRAVQRWADVCDGDAPNARSEASSREREADARLDAEHARRGGR